MPVYLSNLNGNYSLTSNLDWEKCAFVSCSLFEELIMQLELIEPICTGELNLMMKDVVAD